MIKGIGILGGGVFIGALWAEIARRGWPGGFDKLYTKVGGLGDTARNAFKEGYHGAVSAQEPSPTEA